MGEEADQILIPHLDFSCEASLDTTRETGRVLSEKVREACESHGCFFVKCNDMIQIIPRQLLEKMFVEMESLFDLPQETKDKFADPKKYEKYLSSSFNPLHESFGIHGAPELEVARAFTDLMWPRGNTGFCEVLNTTSSKMLNLSLIVTKMILESFHIGKYYEFFAENSCCSFRLLKHKVPPSSDSPDQAGMSLLPHTDKNFLTILSENGVPGLEVVSQDGSWIQLEIPTGSFLVIVGDSLKAWSNGRLHAAKHRVMMRGEKVRYSFGLFLIPKEEATIEAPRELVDDDKDHHHLVRYRPFKYSDYLSFYHANFGDHTLETFAGI